MGATSGNGRAGSPTSGLPLPAVRVGGASLHSITEAQCIDAILAELEAGRGGWVLTTNVDHLWWASREPSYAALCAKATLAVADGMPLLWASRFLGTPLPERITGSNLISSLSVAAASQGRSIFLLGGDPGTAERSADVLRALAPDIRLTGTWCPPYGFYERPEEMAKITAAIHDASPEIVFIALSKPLETLMMAQLYESVPRAWFVGVGISFSFLAGRVRRAPHWMQRSGLEWLHRLAQEPGRLWRRYLVHDLPLAALLLGRAVYGRFRGQS